MTTDRAWLLFEWSDELRAWVITVDKDARLTIDEIKDAVRKDPFVVRISEKAIN